MRDVTTFVDASTLPFACRERWLECEKRRGDTFWVTSNTVRSKYYWMCGCVKVTTNIVRSKDYLFGGLFDCLFGCLFGCLFVCLFVCLWIPGMSGIPIN